MRAAVAERHAETLRAADRDVRAEFAGRLQKGQRQQIRGDDHQRAGCVRLFHKRLAIVNRAERVGVLNQRADGFGIESK